MVVVVPVAGRQPGVTLMAAAEIVHRFKHTALAETCGAVPCGGACSRAAAGTEFGGKLVGLQYASILLFDRISHTRVLVRMCMLMVLWRKSLRCCFAYSTHKRKPTTALNWLKSVMHCAVMFVLTCQHLS